MIGIKITRRYNTVNYQYTTVQNIFQSLTFFLFHSQLTKVNAESQQNMTIIYTNFFLFYSHRSVYIKTVFKYNRNVFTLTSKSHYF